MNVGGVSGMYLCIVSIMTLIMHNVFTRDLGYYNTTYDRTTTTIREIQEVNKNYVRHQLHVSTIRQRSQ